MGFFTFRPFRPGSAGSRYLLGSFLVDPIPVGLASMAAVSSNTGDEKKGGDQADGGVCRHHDCSDHGDRAGASVMERGGLAASSARSARPRSLTAPGKSGWCRP